MATRRFTLYGSSPDQLAAQQRFYDQLGLGAAESNRSAVMNAAAQNIANAERIRQEDEAAMGRDRQERLAYLKLFADEATNRRLSAEDSRRFDASMNLSDRQLAAQIARDKLSVEGRGVSLRKAYFDTAIQSAAEGAYPTLEAVKAANPAISDEEAVQVFAVSQAARQQMESAIDPLRQAAKTLTQSGQAAQRLALAEEKLKLTPEKAPRVAPRISEVLTGGTIWGAPTMLSSAWRTMFPGENPELATARAERDAALKTSARLKALADEIERNKTLMSELTPNERGEYRAPLMPWETRTSPRIPAPAARRLRYNPTTGQIE